MKRIALFFSLVMGLASVASAQPQPIQTIKDYGLKGPVKKVTELRVNDEAVYRCNTLEFDAIGRLSSNCAYDAKGRLIFSEGTYYSYDINDRLLSEQTRNGESIDEYVIYNYDKNGRLTTCERYTLDKKGNKTVDWVKTYKYDKQGRLLGAEAKTPDKKNPKVVFSYQVVYAADGTPKNYLLTHLGDEEYDEYGEVIKEAEMVTDTLPYNEWTTYNVNHGWMGSGPDPDNRAYTKFDSHGNGIEWGDPKKFHFYEDDYGEVLKDTIIFRTRTRTIEYYGSYDFTISLHEMNIVYSGIENPVKIVVNGVPDECVLDDGNWDDLKLENLSTKPHDTDEYKHPFSLEKANNGMFLLTPHIATGIIHVPVVILENGERKVVGYESFRVRRIPDPILYIGKYPAGSVIPREELANMKGIAVRYEESFAFHMEAPKVIKQTIDIEKMKVLDFECPQSPWTPEVKSYMSKVKPGSKVCITAETVLPDGSRRTVTGSWNVGK